MAKIAVIIDNWFEDAEYIEPQEAFIREGNEIINIGLQKGEIVKGKNNKIFVKIDESIGDTSVDVYDALYIPGGYSPDRLRSYDSAVSFVRDFVKSGKPVFVICHGPQLLISAKVLEGKTITGWKSISQDILNAGALYKDEEVIIDGNIVSSRSPRDLPTFIKESIAKLNQ